ncbi:MAG: glycoside hydrolase family 2, partial [Prevotella sp.]|nr:glycoside hydrolase family 2 [Prevotella sp.]
MKKILCILIAFISLEVNAALETSVAGLYQIEGSGRIVYNFNQGWRFYLGDVESAFEAQYDDSSWPIVNTPHSVRLEPSEESGSRNYQGVAWYRKHFEIPLDMKDKEIFVHFEAIMGKQEIYVDGKKVKEHLGGYTPITICLSSLGLKAGDNCVIAVKADNSDDKTFPPGKPQSALDFCYHGGIYRDVWLIGKSTVSITDAVEANKTAGGGVFLHYDEISKSSAKVFINVELGNNTSSLQSPTVTAKIKDKSGKQVALLKENLKVGSKDSSTVILETTLKNPHLWSPEDPYLYDVEILVSLGGKTIDGGRLRMGIRKAEFKGADGFYLNDEPYHQFIGGNRHQDFAYVGNALPNSQQWRDAKRLKDAGMTIVRCAHYPMDPSFMDACDELGLFVIVPTPGWQYWNKDPNFALLVHENTRTIIRRDRNHTSVLMWEPILNETRYPEDFSLKALEITREEFPYPGRPVAVADMQSDGVKDNYDVVYGWPEDIGKEDTPKDKCVFTREFGEMVDDWYAHNCLNRAARSWGERPMLVAALSLCDTYGTMFEGQRQFIGGCQWHPFDHQRGYHPDPYFGGIYDAFRQKKYAFEMFRSEARNYEPMVFIANEMTQFSPEDVVVFSSCDSVRLTAFEGDKTLTLPIVHDPNGKPCAPAVFKGFWDFWAAREYSYKQRDWQRVSLLAEGIKDGKVVTTEKKMPSRRSTKIRLYADKLGQELTADGSDFIVVVAEITDDEGNVKRLAKDNIFFSVEGPGLI